MMRQIAIIICLYASLCSAQSFRGADIPWTTYEAEAMTNTGTTLGPKYDPYLVETESSGQKCVKLAATGQFVEFIAQSPANAIVYATVCRTRRAEAASTPPSASTRMASSSKNFRPRPGIRGSTANILSPTTPKLAGREISMTKFG